MNKFREFLLVVTLSIATQLHAEPVPDCKYRLSEASCSNFDPYQRVSPWAVCPPLPPRDYNPQYKGNPALAPTRLFGNMADRTGGSKLTLIGNAEVEKGDRRLRAQHISYDDQSGLLEAWGEIRYDDLELSLTADHGRMWINEDRGEFFNASYLFYDRHARGTAEISYLLEPGITEYNRATYTTCPENDNFWQLRSSKVTLNENTGVGVARNARLHVKDVPVLYTPYLSFPIDDRRKTGFLMPSFGTSSNSGFEFSVPFYLNLAPNYDATLTARHLEDRGWQLNTEFRYLTPWSRDTSFANLEYLSNDNKTDTNRSRFTFQDHSRFNKNLTTNIDYDRVSDRSYLQDLNDNLGVSSKSFLQRTGEINYDTSWWGAGARVDDYQTVDPDVTRANRPYQRLPRLTFNFHPTMHPLGLGLAAPTEFVRFDHDEKVTGDRIDLWPSLSMPLQRTAFEITPKAAVRYTTYKLSDQEPSDSDSPSRTTPLFSLDNRVFFERNLNLGHGSYMQTLEPRLYYLYVKEENQDDIPVFDSSTRTFTYNELFVENRFSGADRMGDANQATLALTSELGNPETGARLLQASIGGIRYFRDRKVQLKTDTPIETRDWSDIAAQLDIAIARAWTSKADLVWDPYDESTRRINARIQYKPGFRKIANLSYRYLRKENPSSTSNRNNGRNQDNTQNQIDASILWPLTPNWHVLGRWYYDLDAAQILERTAGIEYDNCCWGIRLVAREYIKRESETNQAILLQFVFKGLAHFGNDIESELQDGILGYSERPED